jgi:hypothetical protein
MKKVKKKVEIMLKNLVGGIEGYICNRNSIYNLALGFYYL